MESVAGTVERQRVMFTTGLPLPRRYMYKQKSPNWRRLHMRKLQGCTCPIDVDDKGSRINDSIYQSQSVQTAPEQIHCYRL